MAALAAAMSPSSGPIVPSRYTTPSPYHRGEMAVQDRLGTRLLAERIGRASVRDYLNDQAKAFFNELPLLFVGSRCPDGNMWATALAGQPGFIAPTDDHHLAVQLRQTYGDPVVFRPGDYVGGVGVMLHNRRRNRLNCRVESNEGGEMVMRVVESFGNCPKYIQVRDIAVDDEKLTTLGTENRVVTHGTTALGPEQRAFIQRSDTLLIASGHEQVRNGEDGISGCDCNHRGGSPGFVQVHGDGTLKWPDFVGNNLFQTLGNMEVNPHIGLLFIDFDTGDTLQLTGNGSVLWDERSLPGAQRTMKFDTVKWVHVLGALPITTRGPVQPSPYNPLPASADGSTASVVGLKLLARRNETHDIVTFEFEVPKSAEGEEKPFCEAGQFASFDFPLLKNGETLNRTWTISSPPSQVASTGRFTISVKKAGLVSGYLHEKLMEMHEVVFRGVDGDFTLDRAAKCIPRAGVLLVAGGIGVTPVRAMFDVCLRRAYPVTVLYAIRNLQDAAFLTEFQKAAGGYDDVTVAVALTGSGSMEEALAAFPGVRLFPGRISASLIAEVCPDAKEREVFQCGPTAMMDATTA
eukprot:CAMPEP_0206146014 /NCGR_PEP_ID=MMETSP1473-20131121/29247_1 /ASSEMBLY_ACC=CAM_ASM_001109 /TAXON_ID=1461547 /ORGANISM="Stichococcus sp, Strain RCC1054" /LENGTH=576 /DNA_ID=CAMNT_0053542437 /DNA_START=347 /DNA_END=2074 /DNA_ORIENTATION=+